MKGVLKSSRVSDVLFTCVDTEMKKVQPVRRVENLDLRGGGGTDMSVFFNYVLHVPKGQRPDLTILCTDGYDDIQRDLDAARAVKRPVIILVTQPDSYKDWKHASQGMRKVTVLPLFNQDVK